MISHKIREFSKLLVYYLKGFGKRRVYSTYKGFGKLSVNSLLNSGGGPPK